VFLIFGSKTYKVEFNKSIKKTVNSHILFKTEFQEKMQTDVKYCLQAPAVKSQFSVNHFIHHVLLMPELLAKFFEPVWRLCFCVFVKNNDC